MRWMQWMALLAITGTAVLIGVTVWRDGGPAPVTVSSRPEWQPSITPDNRVETVEAMLIPTETPTPKPTLEARPTMTPLAYCYGTPEPVAGMSCDPRSPTPVVSPTAPVAKLPLTCATVAAGIESGARLSWPVSCTWDG